MSITHSIARKTNGEGSKTAPLDDELKSPLFDALGGALDSIVIGVIIVAEQGRILHANQAAQRMLAVRSPIISLGGCLCALQPGLTKELRGAIATAQADANGIPGAGIGVPLVDKTMSAATAHVLPLACGGARAVGRRGRVRDASQCHVAREDRHRGAHLQPDAGRGAPAPASARRRKPHRSRQRSRRYRSHGADASQSHLHQDRRVTPQRSPCSRHPAGSSHPPRALTVARTV